VEMGEGRGPLDDSGVETRDGYGNGSAFQGR